MSLLENPLFDDDKIKAMIENNRCSTTREIAEKLNIPHTCVERHLKQLGYVNKLDIWVPHKLNEIQLTRRISNCDSLLKRNETDRFLKRIITGDEKWVVYDNVVRKRYKRDIRQIFIKRRLFWVFGWISKVLFILSCSQGTKLSIPMSSFVSQWNWTKKSRNSGQNWQLVKA